MQARNQKTVAVNERGYRLGEGHHNARYPDCVVDQVLFLREEGWGYKRIATAMEMPKRTVRDICDGKRRCQTASDWRRVRVSADE